ncbi:hypothetical protein DRP77_12260 [Candidatus Poribacteria bacterium]|nr:MAG: hypothetical protein DRP77_12260 [Candidatus Poribacteria bacterium]
MNPIPSDMTSSPEGEPGVKETNLPVEGDRQIRAITSSPNISHSSLTLLPIKEGGGAIRLGPRLRFTSNPSGGAPSIRSSRSALIRRRYPLSGDSSSSAMRPV